MSNNQIDAPPVAKFHTRLEAFIQKLYVMENEAKAILAQFDDEVAPLILEGNGDGAPKVTVFNQRDPKWAGIKHGTSNVTIGGYGCLITDVASVLTDAGRAFDPATLNDWLLHNNGYTGGNHFVFNAIDKLNVVKFYSIIECADKPAPVEQLDQFVSEGWFVIVKVDFNPATMQVEEHWVRYLGAGQMMDPWHGDIAPIVPRYKGKDAAQAILRAAIYKWVTA